MADLQKLRLTLTDESPDVDVFNKVTSQLGTSYKIMKEAEKEKNYLRDEFFKILDEKIGKGEAFEFVNKKDGLVYSRQISRGAPSLDDDRLRKEDPELWDEITYVPEPERTLRPLEDLSPEQLAKVSSYLLPGKITPKLGAPRKATLDDLA